MPKVQKGVTELGGSRPPFLLLLYSLLFLPSSFLLSYVLILSLSREDRRFTVISKFTLFLSFV